MLYRADGWERRGRLEFATRNQALARGLLASVHLTSEWSGPVTLITGAQGLRAVAERVLARPSAFDVVSSSFCPASSAGLPFVPSASVPRPPAHTSWRSFSELLADHPGLSVRLPESAEDRLLLRSASDLAKVL